ncbi:oxoglutarate dehydrogenase (succinyl-transferring), E1 component [Elsinoe australis]|uniref:Oxoglutarate dehydrogenase (Succinyl-transferring), E1 component n=1 Tax=Elsinoe australis TaxID=40998 RepID=A0A2P7ZAJ6_9PEZI|nr:oxoglutarate dehydrogenase (succinyl-transferring), E1 component [Elsinoe australis]
MAPNGFPAGQRVQYLTLNDDTATAWCHLPDDETILLLTPVIPQPQQTSNGNHREKDPFEGLGRMLGSIHNRGMIQHVPYVPRIGLTDVHHHHLDETATVLVVVSEPAGLQGEGRQSSIDSQRAFAQAAMDDYNIIHEGTEPAALVLLYCGRDRFLPPNNIETCLQCEGYTGQDWAAVANKLLKGHEA